MRQAVEKRDEMITRAASKIRPISIATRRRCYPAEKMAAEKNGNGIEAAM